jgi:hypothetical protein
VTRYLARPIPEASDRGFCCGTWLVSAAEITRGTSAALISRRFILYIQGGAQASCNAGWRSDDQVSSASVELLRLVQKMGILRAFLAQALSEQVYHKSAIH